MKKRIIFCFFLTLSLTSLFACPRISYALNIFGIGTWGSFTGSLSYIPSDSTNAQLTVNLTNTSNPGNGGFLDAFVFNNPTNRISGVTLSAPAPFSLLGSPSFNNSINGAPHGQFDIGASTGNGFLGGGSPNGGLAPGQSANFTFNLTGTGLNGLTEEIFMSTLSSGHGHGEGYQAFVARFRGFLNEESDKVPGDPRNVVPEPATLSLLGLGVLGLLGANRKRRKKINP